MGALIPSVPFTAVPDGASRRFPTELDRYARLEFREREGTWLLQARSAWPAESAPCESENDGRLLRRLVQAIASFI